MEAQGKAAVNWSALRRAFPGSEDWPKPGISTEFWDDQAWALYYEGILRAQDRKPAYCPGCGEKAGKGPNGCCRSCWRDPPKRRHVPPPDDDLETFDTEPIQPRMTAENQAWIDGATLEELVAKYEASPIGHELFKGETGTYYSKKMTERRNEIRKRRIGNG